MTQRIFIPAFSLLFPGGFFARSLLVKKRTGHYWTWGG